MQQKLKHKDSNNWKNLRCREMGICKPLSSRRDAIHRKISNQKKLKKLITRNIMNTKLVKVYYFTENKQYIIILLFKINNIYGTTDKTTQRDLQISIMVP